MPLSEWIRKRGRSLSDSRNLPGGVDPRDPVGTLKRAGHGSINGGLTGSHATSGNGALPSSVAVGEVGAVHWEAGGRAWFLERSRRLVNVGAAFVLLLLALPVMACVALVVRLFTGGPVLFTQTRVGLDRRNGASQANGTERRGTDYGGRLFRLYKFRTMDNGARATGNGETPQVWASPDDPRITPVGRVLRTSRLDELPQLWNVIRGDMNLVGPRPEQPEIVRDLQSRIDHYPWRHRVRPGITGWAQVNHPYDRTLDDVRRKVALDLEYMNRRSPLEDLRIMLRTVPVILLRRGGW